MEAETQVVTEGNPFLSILMLLVFAAVLVVPYWKIWARTGHSGFLGLLMLIPLVNIISLWVLAFKRWPAVDRD
jgi:hypothetical protein